MSLIEQFDNPSSLTNKEISILKSIKAMGNFELSQVLWAENILALRGKIVEECEWYAKRKSLNLTNHTVSEH